MGKRNIPARAILPVLILALAAAPPAIAAQKFVEFTVPACQ